MPSPRKGPVISAIHEKAPCVYWYPTPKGDTMSQTKAQKRKQQKKKAREKRHRKERNVAHNLAPQRWRLDVLYQGSWRVGVRYFRHWSGVEKHEEETEDLRKKGVEIVAGRIVDMQAGKVVKEISPSPAKAETEDVKGALPDKLADKPEEAKKGIFGFLKRK